MLPLQDVDVDAAGNAVFPCALVPAGMTTTVDDALRAPGFVIDYQELPIVMPVPRWLLGRDTATTTWPLTSTVALRVRHWLHVLRASHLAPQVELIERSLADPLRSAARALLGLRFSKTARFMAWKRQFVFRGRNTAIHPSAIVEASVIGDDVIIGPQAVVLQSIVGDGVIIEQRAHVAQSTLGPRTFVSLNSSMQACVSFADADACANNLQACVIGARSGLTSFARALDSVVGGEVRVDDDGTLRSVGELPCGVAFGPDSYVGANVTIAAGRVIPAGVRVVAAPAGVLRRVGSEPPGTFVVDDGALRSVNSE
jgi:carbonic anhydrase/acetyltransferase-like protein (isoleucine patch superfamily)